MRQPLHVLLLAILLAACDSAPRVVLHPADAPPGRLSDWGVVLADGQYLGLNDGVIPYDLNTPLFSDYALKLRSVWLPAGTAASYREGREFDFPVDRRYGLCKPPVAVGRGSGDRPYDIYPGRPDDSILVYRLQHADPAIAMPELGRSTLHREGVELMRDWIASLPGEC